MAAPTLGRLVTFVRRGDRPACVVLPGAGGGLQPYLRLAGFFGGTHNVHAVRAAGLVAGEEPEDRVATMAASAMAALDEAGVTPDLVFGWSMGGVVGWELCLLLAERGVRPDLVLLDSSPLPRARSRQADEALLAKVSGMLGPNTDADTAHRVETTLLAQIAALAGYRTERPYPGRVLAITCSDPDPVRGPSVARWRELAPDLTEAHLDVDHFDVLEAEHLPALTELLAPFVRQPVR